MIKYETNPALAALQQYGSADVANVVATYPHSPVCLKLYDPWHGKYYTDPSIKCLLPEKGMKAGYAVTFVQAPGDPERKEKADPMAIYRAIEASPKPVIVCLKQEHLDQGIGGICGGQMMAAFLALGAVGFITDGPVRDVDECRAYDMQYLAASLSPGHGFSDTLAVNVPVEIGGMEINPGDIVCLDADGASKFPADRLEEVAQNCKLLIEGEEKSIQYLLEAESVEEVGLAYAGKKKED